MEQQDWPMTDRLERCYWVQGLAHYLNNGNCAAAMPLFETAFLTNLSSTGRDKTLEGMEYCTGQQITEDDIPTPVPTGEATPAPTAESIEIY